MRIVNLVLKNSFENPDELMNNISATNEGKVIYHSLNPCVLKQKFNKINNKDPQTLPNKKTFTLSDMPGLFFLENKNNNITNKIQTDFRK